MRVSFIGSGNVATHLANASVIAGIKVIDICSSKIENAQVLANFCNARAIQNIALLNPEIDLLIIAAKDDALVEIARKVHGFSFPIVHTSGSINIDVLQSDKHNFGVLYPLQTFSKHKEIIVKEIPFFTEANSTTLEIILNNYISLLGANHTKCNSEQRMYLHIAAVFACNFSNYLYGIAKGLLESHNMPFEALKPLIMETASKIKEMSPDEAQTGPAKRADFLTIEKHLKALSDLHPHYELYKLFSSEIEEKHKF